MRLASLLFHDVVGRDAADSGFSGPVADRYKLPLPLFEAHLEGIGRARGEAPVLVRAPAEAYVSGFALTFDDGGVSYATAAADRLEARGWRGHCFVSTDQIGRRGFLTVDQIRDLDRRGHVIGSHSATHPTRFSACPWPRMVEEWRTSASALANILGRPVTVASLPGGYFSRAAALAAAAAGVRVLFTSEPVVVARAVGECVVLGRFAVHESTPIEHVAALATGGGPAVWRERGIWRLKKTIKPLLGPAYPRVGAWLAARRTTTARHLDR